MSRRNQHNDKIDLRVVEKRPQTFMRYADCAADARCSRNHIRGLVTSGKLKACRLHGLLLVRCEDWDKYIAGAVPVRVEVSE